MMRVLALAQLRAIALTGRATRAPKPIVSDQRTRELLDCKCGMHVAKNAAFAHDTAFGFGTTPRLSVLDCESRATLDPT
jgi:hypothetical protein